MIMFLFNNQLFDHNFGTIIFIFYCARHIPDFLPIFQDNIFMESYHRKSTRECFVLTCIVGNPAEYSDLERNFVLDNCLHKTAVTKKPKQTSVICDKDNKKTIEQHVGVII